MSEEEKFSRRSVMLGAGAITLLGSSEVVTQMSQDSDREVTTNSGFRTRHSSIYLERIGGYNATQPFDSGGAEIVSYDDRTQQAFVANEALGAIDVLDLSTPSEPTKLTDIDIADAVQWADASEVTSVAVKNGILAAGVANETKIDDGRLVTVDTQSLEVVDSATVGALPDAVAFTPDGSTVVVANEGEPSEDFQTVPRGSVSVATLSLNGQIQTVDTAGFQQYDGQEDELRERGIRLFGPENASDTSQNMEPEYVTVTDDGSTAWVAMQEANALAEVDIESATVTELHALGYKDHMLPGNEFDASDDDGGPNIRNWPTKGMYHPDGMDSYEVGDRTFIVTANEGDARDFDGYSEEIEVSDLKLDPEAFDFDQISAIDNINELKEDSNLGELETTTADGDIDGDGLHEEIYSYGARSFSIWNDDGEIVFDSGNDFERITAERYPDNFNNDNDESDPDGRSDAKGPEPEGVAVAYIGSRAYAFIGMERMSGVFVYDISVPQNAEFVQYINPRNFDVDIEQDIINGDLPTDAAGDVGTEDVEFVPLADSPIDAPLVLTANEGSGTTGVIRVDLIG